MSKVLENWMQFCHSVKVCGDQGNSSLLQMRRVAKAPVASTSAAAPVEPMEELPSSEDEDEGEEQDQAVPLHQSAICKREECRCFCGSVFSDLDEVSQHITQVHTNAFQWHCSHKGCKVVLKSQSAMWKHFRVQHLKLCLWKCSVPNCSMQSDEKSVVLKHMTTEHGMESNPLKCKNCNQLFSTASSLKRHSPICGKPVEEKPFKCELCNSGYRSLEGLRIHMGNKHPKEGQEAKEHLCPYAMCVDEHRNYRVSFVHIQNLTKHLKEVHEGQNHKLFKVAKKRPRQK